MNLSMLKFWNNRSETSPARSGPVYSRLPTSDNSEYVDVYSDNVSMKLSAAYRCVAILSGTIASLPLEIKRRKNGYFAPDYDNSLYGILSRVPNSRMDAFSLVQNMVIQMIQRGNAYILIRRTMGEVSELVLLSNDSVAYCKYSNTYVIADPVNRVSGTYYSHDIIHIRNRSLDGGYTGVSTLHFAARTMNVASSIETKSLKGSQIKGILSGVKSDDVGFSAMTDSQTEGVADRVERQLNEGRNVVPVNGDAKFSQLSVAPADQQLIELKDLVVLDICRFYGVHPDKAFAGQPTNYKASEMSQVSFLTDTLNPILKQIQSEFSAKLIPISVAGSYKIEFDLSGLYQTDLTTKAAYLRALYEMGILTTNEIRMMEGHAPVKGGDTVMITCNVAPIDSPKITGADKIPILPDQKKEKE